MGGCCTNRRHQESQLQIGENTQRIIIPQGLIHPGSLNIIEIPSRLSETPVLYARRQYCTTTTTGVQKLTVDRSRVSPPVDSAPLAPLRSQSYPGLTYYTLPLPQQQEMSAFEMFPNRPGPAMRASLPGQVMTDIELQAAIIQKEQAEREILERDLEQFQQARRRLLEDTTDLAASTYMENEN